jgi:putative ABC transport system permease protein
MIAGVAVAFGLLWLMGSGLARGAGMWRGRLRGVVRIGIANLAGPRSAARTAAPAIGLGVALLAAIVLIQSSLLAQVSKIAPATAPSMIFAGIPADRAGEFDTTLTRAFGRPLTPETYLRAPFATGRIVAVRGAAVDVGKVAPPDRWAYDNDISISAIGAQPRGAEIVEGRWWPAAYAGPPLVALAVDAAKGAHLKVGDTISVELLGRTIDARVAVIRRIDFAGFGANFPIVLDPAAIEGAGLDEVAEARASPAEEARATRALGADFPRVNVISVREALQTAVDLFGKLSLAIRAAAGVAAVAGLLVLIGAIATGARTRAREAATLKVLGASSGQILLAYGVEYGAVGLIAGVAGVALGYAAAWPIVVQVFKATWSVDWAGVATLVIGAAGLAGLGGLAAALGALAKRPAETLRAE